jgi:low temperature requirement protein LtrA
VRISPLPRWFREHPAPADDATELRVSTLELFFDLVFVFIAVQFIGLIAHDPGIGLAQAALMFAVLWWMYCGYAWLTNAVPPSRPARRILLLCAMGGWMLIGLAVPDAFHGGGAWIAVGLAVVVVVHGLMYLQAHAAMLPIFGCNLTAVALVAAAQLGPSGPVQHLLWAGAALLMWSGPFLFGHRSFRLHPGHIVERHGLVVIIAFGESVVALGVGARGLPVDHGLRSAALLGLAVSACMWWSLFSRDLPRAEAALRDTDGDRRPRLVLLGLTYAFVPLILGIMVFAAGVEHAIGHATEPQDLPSSLLISGGVALFLLATAGLRRSMSLPHSAHRLALAAVVLALTPLGSVNAAVQLSAVAVVLVVALALEERSASRGDRNRSLSVVRAG